MGVLDRYTNFRPVGKSADGYVATYEEPRDGEQFYRNRWRHDRVVRSTHGVNCTGSCSWQIFVKNGVVTWELQETDYPKTRAGVPDYEPRGCPRGASYSWYLYNSGRVKHPMARRELIDSYRAAKQLHPDPVDAWEAVVTNPESRSAYVKQRGLGGFVRVGWDEALEIAAAANVYTIKTYGPDRLVGFTPIPAFSMVSYGIGSRYITLLGGAMLSFYDFYCDLPPASPQTWGEQTEVPESADWYQAKFLMLWGSNVPVTRTPDAHFYTEVKYNGTEVVVVSPDFNDAAKFADVWVAPQQGTDSALGMALGHVVLKEFYKDKTEPYFDEYVKKYTDFPYLVKLTPRSDGTYQTGMLLRANELPGGEKLDRGQWMTVVADELTGRLVVPRGNIADRWNGSGHWNLEWKDARDSSAFTPRLSAPADAAEVTIKEPYFGGAKDANPYFNFAGEQTELTHAVRAIKVKTADGRETLCATVYDLMQGHYGHFTPQWAEQITGVAADKIALIARHFARNAAATRGKSMIIIGAGVNQWYHTDMTYRSAINLLMMCGCIGIDGGGWAHYVGQEKVRPHAGWGAFAFATDWSRPPRQNNTTSYFYGHCDMWRYEKVQLQSLLSPLTNNPLWDKKTLVDSLIMSHRMGWLPVAPQYSENPLDITREARKQGRDPAEYLTEKLHDGSIYIASEDFDAPKNYPRNLFVWRSNLLGCSGKGMEYFMRHLMGTQSNVLGEDIKEAGLPLPSIEKWHDKPVEGKLDLLVTADFRMTTTSLHSDILLPAATWYEKNDLSSTDMHPYIHPFCKAVDPMWEARTDWEIFTSLARVFSPLGKKHLGVQEDIVMSPMGHDSPAEISEPLCVKDWKAAGTRPVPGKDMGNLTVVKRDYGAIYDKLVTVGPLLADKGMGNKGVSWNPSPQVELLKELHGVATEGAGKGQPRIATDIQACDTILTLSPETNGQVAIAGWKENDRRTGLSLEFLSEEDGHTRLTYFDVAAQPRKAITAPTWSGLESNKVGYAPGYINVNYLLPWRTLTGRQQFYQDHPWMLDFGEALPQYRPPLWSDSVKGLKEKYNITGPTLTINVMTPHSKWGIHSTWSDNLLMLTLGRGGPVMWLSEHDAAKAGIKDNDWIEVFNDNGATVARAVVSQRMPHGGAYYYHNPERTVNMPLSKITGNRGGLHNSIARLVLNPLHMIGGYAQLSFSLNYYGCIGSNRDEICIVRKLDKVNWE